MACSNTQPPVPTSWFIRFRALTSRGCEWLTFKSIFGDTLFPSAAFLPMGFYSEKVFNEINLLYLPPVPHVDNLMYQHHG